MIAAKPHEYADELHQRYQTSIPVDVFAIARGEGIQVEEVEIEPSVSGFLVVKDGEVVIGVNQSHHPYRKRFTVAHELGHYKIHGAETPSNVFSDSGETVFFRDVASEGGLHEQERQANQFAADLLMPKNQLKKLISSPLKSGDEDAIRKLALKFDVSFTAMSIRLSNLKLLR
jgi:Zn-dependent peptidase ImmA (M78 family)